MTPCAVAVVELSWRYALYESCSATMPEGGPPAVRWRAIADEFLYIHWQALSILIAIGLALPAWQYQAPLVSETERRRDAIAEILRMVIVGKLL